MIYTKQSKFNKLIFSIVILLILHESSQADEEKLIWSDGSGTEIGKYLPRDYEPSGLVWHPRLQCLFLVGDEGQLTQMDTSGHIINAWEIGGDIEAVTIADETTDHIYIGLEDPDSILEFDIQKGSLTNRRWLLTQWLSSEANQGLEALTFVPNKHHPYTQSSSGGLFYAGLQADGKIYIFDIDLSHNNKVLHVDTITPKANQTDLSGLHYLKETGIVYAIFDRSNQLAEMTPDGTMIGTHFLPGNDQEGITLIPLCQNDSATIFIALDRGPEV